MSEKINVELQMLATASLNKSVANDLKQQDRDMEEVLNEDTKRNDRNRSDANDSNSNK